MRAKEMVMVEVPEFMPVLSQWPHPTGPRGGGCFMEVASFLAGERWTDRPKCADPTLADICRGVNDGIFDDDERAKIAPLIPRVIGTADFYVPDGQIIGFLEANYPAVESRWCVANLYNEAFAHAKRGRGVALLTDLFDWFDTVTGRTSTPDPSETQWRQVTDLAPAMRKEPVHV